MLESPAPTKNQLSKLVKAAMAGEDVVIPSNGTPLVRLVPITNSRGLLAWGRLCKYRASIDAAFSISKHARQRWSLRMRDI
ncbi:MAG: type II toxin-antitoxin system prevent-host-death family antitoxin [Gammaproteobacteria bacterium]|nr:type II toxin-antitoxin system prevent-host-death family antitoxin [Gammaproteobacteria bacterium]